MKLNNLTRNILIICLFMLCILTLISCGGSTKTQAIPTTLNGQWHQVSSGIDKAVMTATVTDNHIDVTMTLGKNSGRYWSGSFDTSVPTTKSYSTVSTAADDQDFSMLASKETEKTFTYENGQIHFEFGIMGVKTTVYMSK